MALCIERSGWIAATLLIAVAGCAAPRYETVTHYQPPTDAAGQACVAECSKKLAECQGRCRDHYQACLQELQPRLEGRYAAALDAYAGELERYRRALRQYEMSLGFCLGHGWPYLEPWPPLYPWPCYPGPYFSPCPPPQAPTREGVLEAMRTASCAEDCGCLVAYDDCYLACGGRKIPERRCIGNCPCADR